MLSDEWRIEKSEWLMAGSRERMAVAGDGCGPLPSRSRPGSRAQGHGFIPLKFGPLLILYIPKQRARLKDVCAERARDDGQ